MNFRTRTLLGLCAASIGVACVDLSAPSGAASISTLLLPSPSVVLGDVMRDSNGAPAPISVVAYDANNSPVPGLTAQFFITDSLHAAHLDNKNEIVGDKIGTVRVLGQIGSLQTAAVSIPVTYAPDHIKIVGTADSVVAPLSRDSATSIGTVSLPVSVRSVGDSASQGFIVSYTITYAPVTAASSKSAAVYLVSDAGAAATADTTDASGSAGVKVLVNSLYLAARDSIYANTKPESVVVLASTKYKGVPVGGSPAKFVIKLRVK